MDCNKDAATFTPRNEASVIRDQDITPSAPAATFVSSHVRWAPTAPQFVHHQVNTSDPCPSTLLELKTGTVSEKMDCNKDVATFTPRNETSVIRYQDITPSAPAATFVGSHMRWASTAPQFAHHQLNTSSPCPSTLLELKTGTVSEKMECNKNESTFTPRNETSVIRYQHIAPSAPAATFVGSHVRWPPTAPQFVHHQLNTFSPCPPDTFWTSCSRCTTNFVYHKMYVNQNIPCPSCQMPFLAMEMPVPTSLTYGPFPYPNHHNQNQNVFVPAGSRSGFTSVPSNERLGKSRLEEKEEAPSAAKEESRRKVKELSKSPTHYVIIEMAKMRIGGLLNQYEGEESMSSHKRKTTKDSLKNEKGDDLSEVKNESVAMKVPDADFHDFDGERIESSFSENQVWAAYDDDDGMPRYYALVHCVISRKPFKVQISWLNSRSSSEFGSLDWIGSGFTKTCGGFRVGRYVVITTLTSFSHPVELKKGPKGAIQIFPTKGEVWAVYQNWSPDWVEGTTLETLHKYDLVVVLEGYNEGVGVVVAPLLKVAGFTSVFSLDQSRTRTIPREEMFRFSHQVPSHILNGQESENAPNGCYELDPAALPLELLKVITA